MLFRLLRGPYFVESLLPYIFSSMTYFVKHKKHVKSTFSSSYFLLIAKPIIKLKKKNYFFKNEIQINYWYIFESVTFTHHTISKDS